MWGKFFLYANKPDKSDFIEKLADQNKGIKMAVTVLKNISQDEINWYHETRYWMHVSDEKTMINAAKRKGLAEGRKEGKAQGRLEGLAEGRNEMTLEIARNAIKANLPFEQISAITSLTLDQIKEISVSIQ